MRIIFVTDHLTLLSGGTRFLVNVFKVLRIRYHYDVHVITGLAYDDIYNDLQLVKNLHIINLNIYKPKALPADQPSMVLKFLVKSLNKIKDIVGYGIDDTIIHLNNHFPNILAYIKRRYIPVVCSIHHLEETSQFSSFLLRLGKLIVQDLIEVNAPCNAIHVPSRFTRNRILKHRLLKANIVIIPPGIEVAKYINIPRKPGDFFVMIGRLESRKHYDHAIMALKIATKYERNLKLFVIGDGPMRPTLEKLIRKYSLEKNVILLGSVSEKDKLNLLSQAKALIHLGYPEGFGIALVEALALGVPVITYDTPPLNEIIIGGVHGFLVRKNDIIGLAQTLLSINKYEFDPWVLKARAMTYDINRIAKHFHRLYTELLAYSKS